jgi:hypothetical protein
MSLPSGSSGSITTFKKHEGLLRGQDIMRFGAAIEEHVEGR